LFPMSSFEMETQMSSKMSSTIFQKVFLGGFLENRKFQKVCLDRWLTIQLETARE
jgi:hypothetical protein